MAIKQAIYKTIRSIKQTRCDYERTYQGSESEDDGLLCGSSIKSQSEICGVYSKKRYTREVVDLR